MLLLCFICIFFIYSSNFVNIFEHFYYSNNPALYYGTMVLSSDKYGVFEELFWTDGIVFTGGVCR